MHIKPDLSTRKYMVKIIKKLLTYMASTKFLLQVAVQDNLLIYHMDVKSACLNAPLDDEIYID